jgi:hydroxymethylpyrimidine/phosphomethylpyrimidine kinase
MLGPAAQIDAIRLALVAGGITDRVVDPVLVDGLDRPLVDAAGIAAYRDLINGARVVTPNRRELGMLIEADITTADDVATHVKATRALGADAVVVTGGRNRDPEAIDVLVTGERIEVLVASRIGGAKRRGTGCALSAAIAALLATGHEPVVAVDNARQFVRGLLRGEPSAPMAARPGLSHLVSRIGPAGD